MTLLLRYLGYCNSPRLAGFHGRGITLPLPVGESGKEYCRKVPRMGSIVVALFLKIWFTIAPDWKKTVYWIIKDTFIHYLFCVEFSSVQFSHSVMFDSFRPHALQHARPPCPSPTPGAYPNSCPLSQWCHPAISSSVSPFSSCPQSLPALGSFPMSQLFSWGGQNTGVSASASVLPMNTQDWSPLGWTGWISLQSKGLSRVFSNTTVQKHQFLGTQFSFFSFFFNFILFLNLAHSHLTHPDAGKDWGQEEKGVTEDEMVGWHHQLNGHEFG